MADHYTCPKCGARLRLYVYEETLLKYLIEPETGKATQINHEVQTRYTELGCDKHCANPHRAHTFKPSEEIIGEGQFAWKEKNAHD